MRAAHAGPKTVRLVQVMAHGRAYATGVARALEQRRGLRLR